MFQARNSLERVALGGHSLAPSGSPRWPGMQEGIPVFFHLGDMPCRRCRMWRLQHAASTTTWPTPACTTSSRMPGPGLDALLHRLAAGTRRYLPPLPHRFKISLVLLLFTNTPGKLQELQLLLASPESHVSTGLGQRRPGACISAYVSNFFVLTPLPVLQRLFLRVCKLSLAQTEL